MNNHEISCTVDGRIFTGTFEVVGHGEVGAVSVQLDGESISVRTGHIPPEIVAQTLLGELVQQRLRAKDQPRSSRTKLELNTETKRYRYSQEPEQSGIGTHH